MFIFEFIQNAHLFIYYFIVALVRGSKNEIG